MDNQTSIIVCPNCGASTTNGHNCDYCGSLLVRFIAENKSVDKTTFGGDSTEILGLKEELRKNLSYQKIKKDDEIVVTSIIDSNDNIVQVVETAHCNLGTVGENPFLGIYDKGITLRVTFETRNEDEDFAQSERTRLNWFKKQSYYFLFTQQNLPAGTYYYIDFGEDIENAAKLISAMLMSEGASNEEYSFETRMVTANSLSNENGLIYDNTAEKSKRAITLASIITISIIVVIKLLFSII